MRLLVWLQLCSSVLSPLVHLSRKCPLTSRLVDNKIVNSHRGSRVLYFPASDLLSLLRTFVGILSSFEGPFICFYQSFPMMQEYDWRAVWGSMNDAAMMSAK